VGACTSTGAQKEGGGKRIFKGRINWDSKNRRKKKKSVLKVGACMSREALKEAAGNKYSR
jgi:hypothetical protein